MLRNLVEQYEALHMLEAEKADSPEFRQRMEDCDYTLLCVSTSTRDVDVALTVAHQRLSSQDDILLAS